MQEISADFLDTRARLLGSFLLFVQTFFPLITGREFYISQPAGRESHFITLARELTAIFRQQQFDTIINVPPGHAKSTLLSMWTAWCLAHNPRCNFLYISYGHELAAKHTDFIKRIINHSYYGAIFDVYVSSDSRAKDNFRTVQGGSVKAFGSSGAITGQDAGLPNFDGFSGAVIIDDAHKPDEVHSDSRREGVTTNYRETILQRPRSPTVPIVYIGQRLHEDDICAYMLSGDDERVYKPVIMPAIDLAGNALYPELNPLSQLKEKELKNPYVFSSQYQQQPIPAGGAIFKPSDFVILDFEPTMTTTFLTCDTAETDKSYNDATVFAFWGYYKVEEAGVTLDTHALHLIDLWEMRVEPKELEPNFRSFYSECLLHSVKPTFAAIEKKSTGVTLLSTLEGLRGLNLREVKRTKASGSKTARFLEMQPVIASKLISLTRGAKFADKYIEHMIKITANNAHRSDDVCHVAGTKITTVWGDKNIEDLKVGDKVITPFGVGNVSACGSTGSHSVIDKFGLEATPNHKVFYKDDFISLMRLPDMIMLEKLSLRRLWVWKSKQLFYLMVRNLDLRHRQDISKLAQENIKTNFFTVLFGSFIQERKYLRAISFIIKTMTNMIIVLKIWSVYRLSSIARFILKVSPWMNIGVRYLKGCGKNHGKPSLLQSIRERTRKGVRSISLQTRKLLAAFAPKSLWGQENRLTCAVINAGAYGQINGVVNATLTDQHSLDYAHIAEMNTQPKACHLKNTIPKHAQESVLDCGGIKEVFNLTVDIYGVYYANGILVSNCDVTYDAVKMALIDKNLLAYEMNEARTAKVRALAHAQGLRASALSSKDARRYSR